MRVWILAIISALVLSNVPLQETRAIASQPKDWTTEAQRSILEREYEATDAGEGLQAPNRAHDLRTYFDAGGARVVGREDAKDLARLRTVAVGGEPVEAGQVVTSGARVEVRRAGLVEWFENTERGLEQGWTVERRPANGLSVELDLGGATARVENGRAVLDANGRRLEYGGLNAWDAGGRDLAARMEAEGERLRIAVDDAGAVYPVTIDPTLTSPAFATIEADQLNAALGAVAGAGDVNGDGYGDVVVGAPNFDAGQTDEGAAFIFYGGPAGIASGSTATAAATLQSDRANTLFGISVAGAGDVNGDGYDDIIVGALFYSSGQSNEGGAFVFHGGPAGIPNGNLLSAATVIESDEADALLGLSVDGAGDVDGDGYDDVVVGAYGYDSAQTNAGAAFVFRGGPAGVDDGTPATAAAALQSDRASSFFGYSVTGAGDTNGDGYDDVVVGAYGYGDGEPDEGAVFVFNGSANGVVGAGPGSAAWSLQSNQESAQLGYSVAGAGDVNGDGYGDVIFGALGYDGGETDEGAAYVYLGGPTGLRFGSFYESNQASAEFGSSVSGAGDVDGDGFDDVVIGAGLYDAGITDEGAAFVFLGGPGPFLIGTPQTAASVVSGRTALSAFGDAIAGAGDVDGDGYDDLLVGASLYSAGQTNEGAAFVYGGGPYGLAGYPSPAATLESNQPISGFGSTVASGGDVNGDGYDDVVVGAFAYDLGQANEGAAFVFLGSAAGIPSAAPSTAAAVLQGDQPGAGLGYSVSFAGDVNGDGYDDVIVGAFSYEAGQTNEGAAFVFLGSASGVASGSPATAATTLQSNQSDCQFGASVAAAGDVDNDGYDDVIVGASNYAAGQTNEGAAFVFRGSASGVSSGSPATAATTIQSDQTNAFLGADVAGAGDVNGDGFDDVVVGAVTYTAGQTNEGAAFVFLGSAAGVPSATPATAATTIQSDQASAALGGSVAGAGDVNADGYDDVVVGAVNYAAGEANEGAAFVFLGGPAGIANGTPATAAATLQSDRAAANMGYAVAGAGDVDGDGYDDVIVGAPSFGSGAAFVFLGGGAGIASGSPPSAAVTVSRLQSTALVGGSVSGAGDVNGDGRDDVVVGASGYDAGQTDEGAAFVYMPGTCCRGRASSDSVGVYAAGSGMWFLRDSNTPGPAHTTFAYGVGGAGYVPIAGDWDGDGVDSPGLYDQDAGAFFLRNSSSPGPADVTFVFGAGDFQFQPIVGDWDGDGADTVGLYHGASGVFFLRNANSAGPADAAFGYGRAGVGGRAIAGDWDGDGDATVGLYDPVRGAFFLKNTNGPGAADAAFNFGPVLFGYVPVAGDFDGDGADTVGLYSPVTGAFFLKNADASGTADVAFGFGQPNLTPIVGDWDGRLHRAAPNTTQNRER